MSTSILGKAKRINGGDEDLSGYVRRILSQKRLSFRDVQRRSGGRITQGYVGAIVNGRYANPSVEKLKALAAGLGESEEEVFRVARGLSPAPAAVQGGHGEPLPPLELLNLMQKVVSDPTLTILVQELVDLPPHAQLVLLRVVRSLSEGGQAPTEASRGRC
jgi:transcriptional regulator with XRE-family HTH domain